VTKNVWATFWATFSQKHLATVIESKSESGFTFLSSGRMPQNKAEQKIKEFAALPRC
jgi:hypothetical protein